MLYNLSLALAVSVVTHHHRIWIIEQLTEVDYHRETQHLVILHGVSVALNKLRVNPQHPKAYRGSRILFGCRGRLGNLFRSTHAVGLVI